MKSYIFLTNEGFTYTEKDECDEPDKNNAQLLGISKGNTGKEALDNLFKENTYLNDCAYNNIYCYRLSDNMERYEFNL